jgi:pimeloyl-ACP methyl ester carboxylesterase
MKPLPFTVERLVFRDDPSVQHLAFEPDKAGENAAVQLVEMLGSPPGKAAIPGYFVMSNAPPNIEEACESVPKDIENAEQGLEEIADHLYRIHQQGTVAPELVITVHGYNTSRGSVRNWYKDIFQYINRYDGAISGCPNKVFIGYRWPSENVELERLGEAFWALPPLPRGMLTGGIIGAIFLLLLQLLPVARTWIGLVLALALSGLILLGSLMLALVIMRLIVYFRDSYRANNFGVLDLVELIRLLDQRLVARRARDIQRENPDHPDAFAAALSYWQEAPDGKVKLSFVGHSMGGFVVTNAVRILSDVFDSRSIEKDPTAEIGYVFCLGRLVLASPDIPVLTIISSRANFLDSSLRRFAESYLFSSEGDIALRIASTAANYIAFPSRTQVRGYRLGNVAIRSTYQSRQDYGIVNLNALDMHFPPGIAIEDAIARSPEKVLDWLFLTYQRSAKNCCLTLADLFEDQSRLNKERVTVSDFFTFFDCTDYKDVTFSVRDQSRSPAPMGLLTRAKARGPLRWPDYLQLTLDYASGKRDVHGGYFQGEFSQQLLYRIAFLGFTGYLKTQDGDSKLAYDPHAALSKLHMQCRHRGVQGFLSPIRYRVDIQGYNLQDTQHQMLEAIHKDPAATP